MNKDLEAVARALAAADYNEVGGPPPGWVEEEWPGWVPGAKASILANPVWHAVMDHLEREVENLGTLDEAISEAKGLLARMRAQTEEA